MIKLNFLFRHIALIIFVLSLVSCTSLSTLNNIKSEKDYSRERIYEIEKIDENGKITYEKKLLKDIGKDDLTNGYFSYRDESGRIIITDIQSEQDRQIVERYAGEERETITGTDDQYNNEEVQLTVFDEKYLSINPDLKILEPSFFMEDYDVNWMCESWLESYSRLLKCDYSCEIEADHYFEKWCFKRIAELTNNETWCEKIKLNIDFDCYITMAWKKKDKQICWDIKGGDNPVVKCLHGVAIRKGDPSVCNDIQEWYETAVKKAGKDASIAIELFSEPLNNCKTEAIKYNVSSFADCNKFWYSEISQCLLFLLNKKPELTLRDCAKGLRFGKIGYCYDWFNINEKYEKLDRKYGNNICAFNTISDAEIPIAGTIVQITKVREGINFLSMVSIFADVHSCGNLDCVSNHVVSDLEIGDGIFLTVKHGSIDGIGKCAIISINEKFLLD